MSRLASHTIACLVGAALLWFVLPTRGCAPLPDEAKRHLASADSARIADDALEAAQRADSARQARADSLVARATERADRAEQATAQATQRERSALSRYRTLVDSLGTSDPETCDACHTALAASLGVRRVQAAELAAKDSLVLRQNERYAAALSVQAVMRQRLDLKDSEIDHLRAALPATHDAGVRVGMRRGVTYTLVAVGLVAGAAIVIAK